MALALWGFNGAADCYRRNAIAWTSVSTLGLVLQWGRRLLSAEWVTPQTEQVRRLVASMGPPIVIGGMLELGSRVVFGVKASMGPPIVIGGMPPLSLQLAH